MKNIEIIELPYGDILPSGCACSCKGEGGGEGQGSQGGGSCSPIKSFLDLLSIHQYPC